MRKHHKYILRFSAACLCALFLLGAMRFPASSVSYTTSSNYASGVYYNRLVDVSLTGDGRVDIVNVALSQFGYSEANSDWDLSGMQEGIYNFTEFGHWYGVQSLWCAMFVSWCAYNAGVSENIVPSHAYTPSGVLWFMDRNQAYSRASVESGEYTPQPGDIIYFHFSRNNNLVNHVGIVIGYFDGYVYTVEGNVNFDPNCSDGGQVLVRSRHISDKVISYICCPDYSGENTHEVGNFFPIENDEPSVEEPEITLSDAKVDYIESANTSSEYTSQMPQYSFIP